MAKTKSISAISAGQDTFQDIDGLLSGVAWDLGVITYSYPDSASDYGRRYGSNEPNSGFKPLNATQQAAVDYAIDQFDSVIALSFQKIEYGAANDKDAIIRYAESNKPSTAWAYYPSESPSGGDVWVNNSKHQYDNPEMGNYAWLTFIHETGHALGLKHPHEQSSTFGVVDPTHDSLEYSVMSYRSYVGDSLNGGYTNETFGYPQTLMMDDIAALQYMYGPDWTTYSGTTVYKWSPTTGQLSISENGGAFVGEPQPGADRIFMTVWDGGGTDTYDFSDYSTNLLVDLQPGHWTRTDTVNDYQTAHLDFYEGNTHLAAGNIANALTYKTYLDGQVTSESLASLIENALGGSGNDVFVGNQVNNTFNGGLGADSYTGGEGADIFVFDTNDGGIDHVLDFNPAQGDKIDAHGLTYSVTLTADGWTEVIFGTDYAVILDGFNSQDPNSGWLIA